jgi:hypothetical protein
LKHWEVYRSCAEGRSEFLHVFVTSLTVVVFVVVVDVIVVVVAVDVIVVVVVRLLVCFPEIWVWIEGVGENFCKGRPMCWTIAGEVKRE